MNTTFSVTYENGHFYTEDGKRLILSERRQFEITGKESNFSMHDDMLETFYPRDAEAIKQDIEKKYGKEKVIKMLSAGTRFSFSFGLGKKKKGVSERVYKFQGTMDEDLYLHLITGKSIEVPESWRIGNCICSITDCISYNFVLPETISAKSPSAAFAMLISTHFSQQRGTGMSIYNHFSVNDLTSNSVAEWHEKQPISLGQLRERVLSDELRKRQLPNKE